MVPIQITVARPLLNEKLSETLSHAGYGLVGDHSAVKICRWVKRSLQGRGGCYKHTFYGIASHRCIEASTFLGCANRCVFCWRHNSHPVAKTFDTTFWTMDPPQQILDGMLAKWQQMIKPLKGIVPNNSGTLDRFYEALTPAHCALSLVGEPIMYPQITEFIHLLHQKRISSFLVTNGQNPESLESLDVRVTQLYVSLDAPDEVTLKKLGRPIFPDFWDRLNRSMEIIRTRGERTVARLTLIKKRNDFNFEGYAKLICKGMPSFVEIKAFVFPGPAKNVESENLSIHSSPSENELLEFSKKLCNEINRSLERREFELVAMHAHSCSALLARKSIFCIDGDWHHWIDFEGFLDGRTAAAECRKEAPPWATDMVGFDPQFDVERFENQMKIRNQKQKEFAHRS